MEVYMLVECKAPDVKLTDSTFEQLTIYNQKFNARYLCITNGKNTYCCKMDYERGGIGMLAEIPEYP
jgi:hypothetical protein